MRTIARLGLGITLLVALVVGWRLGSAQAAAAVPIRTEVLAYEADAEQIQMTRWAANRFEAAGLQVPKVEIHFHADPSGCRGNLGYALDGRVDLCTIAVGTEARRAILHEMGHIWLDEHLTPSVRDRFVEVRGLRAWNAGSDPWRMRGYEQGAEMMAWALGERILTTPIPDNAPAQLADGFWLLTGAAPVGHVEIDLRVNRAPTKA